ncbi:hypothetical protein T439DRAFT_381895 [Meredithblackwellia eburnea MCA 4105]
MDVQSPPKHDRRSTFHLPPLTAQLSQAKRRELALDAQRQRRNHAFMAARTGLGDDMDDNMGELALESSDDEELGGIEQELSSSKADAHEGVRMEDAQRGAKAEMRKKEARKPYKKWAKNLLMHGETLDLSLGLPFGLETEWSCVAVPEGKRTLACSSGFASDGPNTTLFSRVSGRTLEKRRSDLPPDCLLDCVWDERHSVLWVLDLVKWRGQWFVECEAQMRFFFLAAKLAELPPTLYQPPSSTSPFILLPCPTHSQLPTPTLNAILDSLPPEPPVHLAPTVLLPSPSTPETPLVPGPHPNPFPVELTGLLLYLSRAHYESGPTTLVGWVPCEVESELKGKEGTGRLKELVEVAREGGGVMEVADEGTQPVLEMTD